MQTPMKNAHATNHLSPSFPHLHSVIQALVLDHPCTAYRPSIYAKSGNPSNIPLTISSSSAFLLCAELVALVSGCLGGGVAGRGGVRVKGRDGVVVVEVVDWGAGTAVGLSKMDHGSL